MTPESIPEPIQSIGNGSAAYCHSLRYNNPSLNLASYQSTIQKSSSMILKAAILITAALFVEIYSEEFVFNFRTLQEAILDCPEKGTDDISFRIRLAKYNRTTKVMSGQLVLKKPFDDSLSLRVKMWTWKNGGWKAGTGFDFRKDKACSSLVTVLGPVWSEVTRNAGVKSTCPYKEGSYNVTNLDASVWEKLSIPAAALNKYKLEVDFEKPVGVVRGCFSCVYRVTRK